MVRFTTLNCVKKSSYNLSSSLSYWIRLLSWRVTKMLNYLYMLKQALQFFVLRFCYHEKRPLTSRIFPVSPKKKHQKKCIIAFCLIQYSVQEIQMFLMKHRALIQKYHFGFTVLLLNIPELLTVDSCKNITYGKTHISLLV